MRNNQFFIRLMALLLCVMTLTPFMPAASADIVGGTLNLNDGVYTYGRFDKEGNTYDKDRPIESGFRNANYLPVEGGREITLFLEAAEWNGNNIGMPFQVVEYDLGKNVVGLRSSVSAYFPSGRVGLRLNDRTAYIRLAFTKGGEEIATPLDMIEFAVYYVDEYVNEFQPYFSHTLKTEDMYYIDPLYGKHIVYHGDSIAESRLESALNGGGYAKLIADATNGRYTNLAVGGATLTTHNERHNLVDELSKLPKGGDLYCFQAGINDYTANVKIGYVTPGYADAVDTSTICGAMEYIFRYTLMNLPGKPVCFVITHKVRTTAVKPNANGDTFQDYHDAMVAVCNKYSIPYYDAFLSSGLNGWNATQSNYFLSSNETTTSDGTHPNEEGYRRYYVPQLLSLFRSIVMH